MKRLLFILAFAWTSHAFAAVIFNNGGPKGDDGIRSDLGGGSAAMEAGSVVTFGASESLQSIEWWGFYYGSQFSPQGPDAFTLRIYAMTGSIPGTTPLYQYSLSSTTRQITTTTIQTDPRVFIYQYDSTIPGTTLPAGTYLIGVMNDTSTDPNPPWLWANGTATTGTTWKRYQSPNPDTSWTTVSNIPALNISGVPVPEPSTAALGAVAGLCWLPRRWRRRPAQNHPN